MIFSACTDNFEELNKDPKHPEEVGADVLLTNAQIDLSDYISSTNVNLNIWKLVAQYWTERTYTDEANYDIVNRRIPDHIFRGYYSILKDLDDAYNKINSEELTEPNLESKKIVQANQLAIIDLLEVYIYQRLVDIFGNIPYSEALQNDNYTPVYDDAATIYADLLKRAQKDAETLDASEGSFGTADLVYSGDVANWKKFAYSLVVKIAINLSDVDETTAQTAIEGAYDKVFASSTDDALLPYQPSLPYVNPLYQDLILSGRHDFVACATFLDKLREMKDPRSVYYFDDTSKLALNIGQSGGSWSYYAHFGSKVAQPDFPGIFMTYDEVMFYLSESAARGFSVGKTAEEYYNDAVSSSVIWWGGTQTDADTLLAHYGYSSYTDWKEAIGTQAWIAMYTRGLVGYTFYRRLDYPELPLPPSPPAGVDRVPTRFTYPINEQTLNASNYQAASDAIGGDKLTTKLFWDKN